MEDIRKFVERNEYSPSQTGKAPEGRIGLISTSAARLYGIFSGIVYHTYIYYLYISVIISNAKIKSDTDQKEMIL